MAELGSSKIYGDLNISNNLIAYRDFIINNAGIPNQFNINSINIGRGNVFIENNNNDNESGAGITLRTSDNPASGDPDSVGNIFAVRSSGQALRFAVGESEVSTGLNNLRTNQVIASSFTGDCNTNSRSTNSSIIALNAAGMNNHRTSADHDSRYLQTTPAHSMSNHSDCTGTTDSRTSTSTTLLLQAKGMNDHRLSGDHDSRYTQKSGDTISGTLTVDEKFHIGDVNDVSHYCSYFNSAESGPFYLGSYNCNATNRNIDIRIRFFGMSGTNWNESEIWIVIRSSNDLLTLATHSTIEWGGVQKYSGREAVIEVRYTSSWSVYLQVNVGIDFSGSGNLQTFYWTTSVSERLAGNGEWVQPTSISSWVPVLAGTLVSSTIYLSWPY